MGIMQSQQQIESPLLKKVEDGIEAKLDEKGRGQYQAILLSGLQIMFGKKTRALLDRKLNEEGDIVSKIASGVASLVAMIYQESNGQMEMPYAVPAGIVLAMYALDTAAKAGLVPEITTELVEKVTQATSQAILGVFGIDRDMVQKAIEQRGQAAEEPAAEQQPASAPEQQGPAGGLMMGA